MIAMDLYLLEQHANTIAPGSIPSTLWIQLPLAGLAVFILWKAWKEFQSELARARSEHRAEREKSQEEFLKALSKLDAASSDRTKEVVDTIHRSELGVVSALNDMGLEFRVFMAVVGHKDIQGADTDKIAAIARRAVEEIRSR